MVKKRFGRAAQAVFIAHKRSPPAPQPFFARKNSGKPANTQFR